MINLLLLLFVFASSAWSLCYTPDGLISNDISCNATAPHSICCRSGYYCTSSNLCLKSDNLNTTTGEAKDNVYIRGTCSDKTWQAPECGGNCVKANPDGGESVQYCGNGEFCCGNSRSCCSGDPFDILNLGVPKIYATAGVFAEAASPTRGPSQTGDPSLSSSQGESQGEGRRRGNNSVAIGISVGVSLSVLLAAVVVGGVWWIRRIERRLNVKMVADSNVASELGTEEKTKYELDGGPGRMETQEAKAYHTYRVEMPDRRSGI